jgi:hypothetical protein
VGHHIQVVSGNADVNNIEQELKNFTDSKCNRKVKKIEEDGCLTTSFPIESILDTLSRSKGMELALYNVHTKVKGPNG